MANRTALVTGATGFIATRLVPALVEQGWHVRANGRRRRPDHLPAEVDYQAADLAGSGAGAESARAALVDGISHIFHLAGASSSLSSQEEMERSNADGTGNLLEAAAATGRVQRFVHMSSTSIYGEEEQLPLPVTEDVDPHPSRGYGKAKWSAELRVWDQGRHGLPVTVLRPVSVHGPGSVKLLASAILDAAIERFAGLDHLVVPEPAIEQRLVHIDDLVRASIHLATNEDAAGRAFNVVSGVYPTSHEIATALAAQFDMKMELSDDPDCGPSYEERKEVHERMVEEGMVPKIILSKERFRFMRKANRNNRLSIDALLGTGFKLEHTDTGEAVEGDLAWYRDHRWII